MTDKARCGVVVEAILACRWDVPVDGELGNLKLGNENGDQRLASVILVVLLVGLA
jgi:hypothetical protein